jgi:HSP20 family protein
VSGVTVKIMTRTAAPASNGLEAVMADKTQDQSKSSGANQGRELSRSQTGLSRRGYSDPFLFPSFGGGLLSSPFTLMRRMMEDFDRTWSGFGGATSGAGGMMSWSPAVEVTEHDGNLVVCAELPGLGKDDVHVEATEDALIIEGEKKQEHKTNEGGVHRSERSYGHFYRAIPLPQGTNPDQAKAKFNNGVLEVTIPVPQEQNKRRQIPLEEGEKQQHEKQQK